MSHPFSFLVDTYIEYLIYHVQYYHFFIHNISLFRVFSFACAFIHVFRE